MRLSLLLVMCGLSATLPAQSVPRDSVLSARLAALARVWAAATFSHPWLAYRTDINLDSLTIAAIGAVSRDGRVEEYERALRALVSALNDPATRVISSREHRGTQESADGPRATVRRHADGIVLVTIGRSVAASDDPLSERGRLESEIAAQLRSARALVFDLRTRRPEGEAEAWAARDLLERQLSRFAARTVTVPAERGVSRTESPNDVLPGSAAAPEPGVHFLTGAASVIQPRGDARPIPVVVIVNVHSVLPRQFAGLVRQGAAAIVGEGDVGDAPFVSFRDIDAGEGLLVRLRLTELVDHDGAGAPPLAAIVDARRNGGGDAAMTQALALAGGPWPRPALTPSRLSAAAVPRHAYVPMDSLPAVEARIFALVKIWGIAATFGRAPPGRAWENLFADVVPLLHRASTVTDYHLALAAALSRLEDSHASLNSPPLQVWRGQATLPLVTAFIEGSVVVTHVGHDSLFAAARPAPGDIIRSIDREDALTRGYRIADTFSASTPARRHYNAAVLAGRGPPGSTATVVIEDSAGRSRTLTLPRRSPATVRADVLSRLPAAVRFVSPGIGYLDPSRLHADSVDAAFARLRGARAIILDWREAGGATWPFVSRLLRVDSLAVPSTYTQVGWREGTLSMTAWDTNLRPSGQLFGGDVVLVIGPRAQSSMEVNALYLRLANGTPFVGAPTSGTIAGTTRFYVPGGVQLVMSSGRGPDRRGLQPDLAAASTIAGARAGRDEVLEAAVAYLTRLRPPADR